MVTGSEEQRVQADLMAPIRELFERGAASGLGSQDISALVPLLTVSSAGGAVGGAKATGD